MTIQAFARVAFENPLPDMGDRTIQGITTIVASDEWMAEADYQQGRISDVTVYRNTSATAKGADPTWEWYAGVPTANIKAYKLAGELPGPSTLKKADGKPKAQDQATRTQAAVSAGK